MNFEHVSVLLEETIENLNIKSEGIYVDGTLGGGGHASEICKKLSENGLFIGIDQDEDALNAAGNRLGKYENRKIFVHDNFSNIKNILFEKNIKGIDGVVLDLGVSSYQLDEASRGFSYMQDAPLDMRMDQRKDFNAKDVVNNYDEKELERIIKEYGEERWAKRIANYIVKERSKKQINTTGELVEIIKNAIPASARRTGPHPAKRTFQAIRIEVNNELGILEQTIRDISEVLNPGGRICIITFHSLEDRIIKNVFKDLSTACKCPPEYPICQCKGKAILKRITKKPILPSSKELEMNPRSRSAKLRVAEKL
ncbi:16S rRNA (cytosine(1402)-N(4))-methyltransferase RsmH [Crassaminicella thermophila]|uniref:Ribosomal RNA small subunit methyltransferase H n=1 Tax=Crassaminicella thermophila TaxID=2599308 RepID=A0A5C0SBF5_CRATE|nr:16S rRNA (cytosine(1402)-N(4))-methyltransferase RsmH [Crassaminicella thermophila]QEK11945.1 16S rRNA (cytosine(1402)-N(4))-methyltransferase RsmH [Crassaminicella thermophila]